MTNRGHLGDRSDRIIAAWIALLLFGVYLLSFSGRFYSQDSMLMFSTTESFVKRGEFNTDPMWTIYKARGELGPDGEAYSKTGYGASLFAAPLYALALALPGDLGLTQATLLTNSIVIALAGALVFLAARRLRFSRGIAVVTALSFGLATPAWVYAKQFWSEPYSLFTLFAAFYFLLCFRQESHERDALIASIALGLAVATRLTNAVLVPFFAWYGFAGGVAQSARAGGLRAVVTAVFNRRTLRGLVWFAAALAVFALSIAWYNWVRYGSPLNSGYRPDETFDNPILFGMYGLLFSPGKGLFVYVPFLAALPWAGVVFFRRFRSESFLLFVTGAIYLITFSAWYYWWGGTNWGPRFLVPLLPFLALLIAPAVQLAMTGANKFAATQARNRPSSVQAQSPQGDLAKLLPADLHLPPAPRTARGARAVPGSARAFAAIFFALCLLSFAFELLGISIPSLAYRARMLRLSANADWDTIFIPQFSPLVGSFSILKPSILDFAWIRVLDNSVNIDWLVIALTLTFIALCGVALWLNVTEDGGRTTEDGGRAFSVFGLPSSVRGTASSRGALLTMTAAVIALSLFSLYRYRDDFRFGGNDGYHALMQAVQHDAQPRDVMILDDDVFMPFFLNENRASIRWYGLSRDPQQWDDATRALLARLSQQYARVWFAYDDSTLAQPDPARDWLEQSLQPVDRRDFNDGVHLVLFAGNARR